MPTIMQYTIQLLNDCQHKLARCRPNCYLYWKVIIDFQKCVLTANHGGPWDRHFKYVLDLTDKVLEKLAAIPQCTD